MSLATALINELKHESVNTRKILQRLPEDKWEWRPHEKSMTLGRLANHIVELPQWVPIIISNTEFDIMAPNAFKRAKAATQRELFELSDLYLNEAVQALEATVDEQLQVNWQMKRGDITIVNTPRKIALRHLTLNHIVHHRGQLSVFLRLLDIAVPGMYGPSADER